MPEPSVDDEVLIRAVRVPARAETGGVWVKVRGPGGALRYLTVAEDEVSGPIHRVRPLTD